MAACGRVATRQGLPVAEAVTCAAASELRSCGVAGFAAPDALTPTRPKKMTHHGDTDRAPDLLHGREHHAQVVVIVVALATTITTTSVRCERSGVGGALVLGMACGLELEGGMLRIEVPGQAVLQLVKHPGQVSVVEAGVVDDHVRG